MFDDETKTQLIEKKLREIHEDLDSVFTEEDTGRAVLRFEDGTEMVRAEFQSDSETYRLMKLLE